MGKVSVRVPEVDAEGSSTAQLLGAFTFANDLAFGLAEDDSLRAAFIANRLAEAMDLPASVRADVYYASLLKDAGCTSFSSSLAAFWQSDEIVARRELILFGGMESVPAFLEWAERYVASDASPVRRGKTVASVVRRNAEVAREAVATTADVARRIGERLGMPATVIDAVASTFEQWDGRGMPEGLAGDGIPIAARVIHPTLTLAPVHTRRGREATIELARSQRGRAFDPDVADAFLDLAATPEFWDEYEDGDPWRAVLAAEPTPPLPSRPELIDDVILAFADFADLKAPHIRAHSRRTADLAVRLADVLGCAPETTTNVRRAALLQDLGLVAISSSVLAKPRSRLTRSEQERLRLHPYYAERVLERVPVLRQLAPIVGAHHERIDGSGYYRGLDAAHIPLAARIVAVASEFDELSHDSPGRPALPAREAEQALVSEAGRGFARDVVRALPAALGERATPHRTTSEWPAGLTEREIEVLRLAAGEITRRGIARRLQLSENTVRHHLEHIYNKTGTGTRVGAVLFAMEHGLLE